jgi:UDP-N-acetylmuramoyl-tripeptide--D-alanyl-D-alanine ligase
MHAGIEVLAELEGPKWLVIGDMAELGEFAASAHTEVGEFARAKGVERLFAMGGLAKLAVDSFGAGAQWFADAPALAAAVTQALAAAGSAQAGGSGAGSAQAAGTVRAASPESGAGSAQATGTGSGAGSAHGAAPAGPASPRILIKGSRVNRLERVVDVLVHGSIQQTGGH